MKTLSLKLDDAIYEEADKITAKLKIARDKYIKESMNILSEFEKLMDEN